MKKALLALAVAGVTTASMTARTDTALYGRKLRLRSYSGRKCNRPGCDKQPYKTKPYCSKECAHHHKAKMSTHRKRVHNDKEPTDVK